MTPNCSPDPGEDDEHGDELPRDGFWQFVQKFFGCANPQFHQLSGWLVSDDPAGEEAGCEDPGQEWLHVVCGCEAGWTYYQFLKNDFEGNLFMVEKWTWNYLATALVDISAVSMLIARSLKTWDICGIVLCDKTAHLKVAFYCPQHTVHLCNDHAV